LNRLCFGATEVDYKPQRDLPSIDVIPDGTFCVEDRTYGYEVGPQVEMVDVATAEEAVAAARRFLNARLP
jgi:hypothetical protein